jgi:RNA polymerase sigma-70 factor (ECF subfamily)
VGIPSPGITALMDQEEALVAQACSGDVLVAREAWRILYERTSDEIYSFLLCLLKDEASAEDMLQETYLRAFRHLPQLASRRSFRGWIRRIARNNVLDHLRSQQKTKQLQTDAHTRGDLTDTVAKRESIGFTQRALETLSLEDRLLLLQRYGQGLKLTELAEALACTERTVRNRLDRAATRLASAVLTEKKES